MHGKKILLIDDDPEILKLTSLIFEEAGAQVFTAHDGLEGISKMFTHRPNLIILDVMMPGQNGFEICERIRQITKIPLIMLTALNNEKEILKGLDVGADDFLTKPFNSEILLARARTVMRRSEQNYRRKAALNYDDGRLKIDVEKHRVFIGNDRLKLTPVEFRLLVYLSRNAGRVLTFDEILINVWGSEYLGSDDYVHVYISHLRSKIESDAKKPRYIFSVHGVGYIFESQEYSL